MLFFQKARYELYSSSALFAPIKDVERKIILVPIVFLLMCSASFVCDLYFFIDHVHGDGGLNETDINSRGIIFVHFVIVRSPCSFNMYALNWEHTR